MNSMPAQRAMPRTIRFIPQSHLSECSAGLRLMLEIYEHQCRERSRACEGLFSFGGVKASARAHPSARLGSLQTEIGARLALLRGGGGLQVVLATQTDLNTSRPLSGGQSGSQPKVVLTTCQVCALLPPMEGARGLYHFVQAST